MADKATTIAQMETAYSKFRETLNTVPDQGWDEVMLGSWHLHHLLAHMAGWAREIAKSMERVKNGEPPVPEGVSYANADAWNARFAATATPGKHALVNFDHAITRYIDMAKTLPEDLFGTNDQGRPKIGNRLLGASGIEHFAEHQEELDKWLASR